MQQQQQSTEPIEIRSFPIQSNVCVFNVQWRMCFRAMKGTKKQSKDLIIISMA